MFKIEDGKIKLPQLPALSTLKFKKLDEISQNISGIYFILTKEKEPIYIGQSTNIYNRLHTYESEMWWFTKAEYFAIYEVDDMKTAELIEAIYILQYEPMMNRRILIELNTTIANQIRTTKRLWNEMEQERQLKSYREHHPAFTENW